MKIESFRFEEEYDYEYEYEIFTILSSAQAWTSVILAGKRDSRRHATASFSERGDNSFILILNSPYLFITMLGLKTVQSKAQFFCPNMESENWKNPCLKIAKKRILPVLNNFPITCKTQNYTLNLSDLLYDNHQTKTFTSTCSGADK